MTSDILGGVPLYRMFKKNILGCQNHEQSNPPRKLTWLAGKSTMNEDVFPEKKHVLMLSRMGCFLIFSVYRWILRASVKPQPSTPKKNSTLGRSFRVVWYISPEKQMNWMPTRTIALWIHWYSSQILHIYICAYIYIWNIYLHSLQNSYMILGNKCKKRKNIPYKMGPYQL